MSPVPQAVIDAEAKADELIAQLAEGEAARSAAAAEQPDLPLPEEEAPAVDEPEAEVDETVPPEVEEPEVPEPEITPQEDGEVAQQLAELTAKFDKLQAAHDTLRGKTYAEVPRVISENKALREQVAQLQADLAAKPAEPAAPSAKASEILASLKEDVNEDVADRILQLIDASVAERVENVVAPFQGQVASLEKTATERAQEAYVNRLTEKVSDWRTVAADPEYAAYLQEVDAFSGKTRYDLASEALAALDANRMSVFFNSFKESKGITPAPAQGRKVAEGKEALVSPRGQAKTGARDVAGKTKPDYITTAQMMKFNKMRSSMSPEAEAKMEARIDRAIQNGWIV